MDEKFSEAFNEPSTVVNIFATLISPFFLTVEGLSTSLKYGDILDEHDFFNGSLYIENLYNKNNVYDLLFFYCIKAEYQMMYETKEALKKKTNSYEDYLLECVKFSLITKNSIYMKSVTGLGFDHIANISPDFVEKLLLAQFSFDQILFTLTLDQSRVEGSMEKFSEEIKYAPFGWLESLYGKTKNLKSVPNFSFRRKISAPHNT